ncbi:type II toxin-antitoxin system RelE/ParE family toxin [Candidatus Dependentiae bacterium]|nr:type II toxin-antitoxin system RelE/ParE family toxin [Candidatus Dependentiae bacterium]
MYIFFKEDSGNEPVRDWLLELSDNDRKIIGKDIRTVQIDWPIGLPLIRSLGNTLWEIRSNLDNRIARTIFILHNGSIILLHGFIKKSQKTQPNDITLALKRAKKLWRNHEKK